MKSGIAIALGFAAVTVAGSAAQTRNPLALDKLTVPASALPEGCTLRPIVSSQPGQLVTRSAPNAQGQVAFRVMIGGDSANAFASNPFVARERSDVYRIRTAVDGGIGGLRLPDAPPLTASEVAAFQMRYVEHVVDGYWASYTTPQNDSVELYAIRFDDPSLALETRKPGAFDQPFATPRPPSAAGGQQIVKGPVVVVVRGNTSTRCFGAVWNFVQSLNVK